MPTAKPVQSRLTSRRKQLALKQLRSSLVGARLDLLKTCVFAAVLVAVLAMVARHSGFTSADNQYAANAAAALSALENTASNQGSILADSARANTEVIASATREKVTSIASPVGAFLKPATAAAPAVVPPVKAASHHRNTRALAAESEGHALKVAMLPHAVEHPVKLSAAQAALIKSGQLSFHGITAANAFDRTTDVIGAESSKAYYSFLSFIQNCTASLSFPQLRNHAQSWMSSAMDRFMSGNFTATGPAAFISNAFSVDSAVTFAAAILFLIVCMAMFSQIRSGLRGVGDRTRA